MKQSVSNNSIKSYGTNCNITGVWRSDMWCLVNGKNIEIDAEIEFVAERWIEWWQIKVTRENLLGVGKLHNWRHKGGTGPTVFVWVEFL